MGLLTVCVITYIMEIPDRITNTHLNRFGGGFFMLTDGFTDRNKKALH
jgi:hypothetical protein